MRTASSLVPSSRASVAHRLRGDLRRAGPARESISTQTARDAVELQQSIVGQRRQQVALPGLGA